MSEHDDDATDLDDLRTALGLVQRVARRLAAQPQHILDTQRLTVAYQGIERAAAGLQAAERAATPAKP